MLKFIVIQPKCCAEWIGTNNILRRLGPGGVQFLRMVTKYKTHIDVYTQIEGAREIYYNVCICMFEARTYTQNINKII